MFFSVDYHLLNSGKPRLPESITPDFRRIVDRARKLLAERNTQTLGEKSDDFDVMLYDAQPSYFMTEREESDDSAPKEETLAAALFRNRHNYELDARRDLHWFEYFGLLAIKLVSDACLHEQVIRSLSQEDITQTMKHDYVTRFALHALEAVCYGEALHEAASKLDNIDRIVEKRTRQKIGNQSRMAAERRNEKYNRIKAAFFEFCAKGQYHSKADAARRFYRSLPPEQQLYRSEEHAIRNLTQALRDAQRALRI